MAHNDTIARFTRGPERESDGLPESITLQGETFPTPDLETIGAWVTGFFGWSYAQRLEAVDGCELFEADATCCHGAPSWLRALELI